MFLDNLERSKYEFTGAYWTVTLGCGHEMMYIHKYHGSMFVPECREMKYRDCSTFLKKTAKLVLYKMPQKLYSSLNTRYSIVIMPFLIITKLYISFVNTINLFFCKYYEIGHFSVSCTAGLYSNATLLFNRNCDAPFLLPITHFGRLIRPLLWMQRGRGELAHAKVHCCGTHHRVHRVLALSAF
jgi:hypothetical protein